MLNYTQQQILDAFLTTTLLEDTDYQELPAASAIKVLQSIENDNDFNANKASLNAWNVLDTVAQIRRILRHECPQNVNQTHFDTKVGYVCYKDFYGKRTVEKKGLLGLTAKSDSTAEPVTKRDVVKYITDVIEREISYQQRLLKRENQILDQVAHSHHQTPHPTSDESQHQQQLHVDLPQVDHQNNFHHHVASLPYHSNQQVVGNSQLSHTLLHSYSEPNLVQLTHHHPHYSAPPHIAQLPVQHITSHDTHHHHEEYSNYSNQHLHQQHAPSHHSTPVSTPTSTHSLPPIPIMLHQTSAASSAAVSVSSVPSTPLSMLSQSVPFAAHDKQSIMATSGSSELHSSQVTPPSEDEVMQSIWISLEGMNHFGYQSGELCRYYEEQIEGIIAASSPLNLDACLTYIEKRTDSELSDIDKMFHRFLVCYLQFYCLEDNDAQPFAELLEQLKTMTSDTHHTNCIGNLTILCTYLRGICFEQQKLYNSAIPHYKRVIRMDPMFSKAYLHRGRCFYLLKMYEKAREDFNNAILADSTLSEAYSYRGLCYFSSEKYDKAIDDYQKAIELDGQDYRPYAYRGECLCAMKKYRRAIPDYDKAISFNNRDSYIFHGRGMCYKHLEKYDSAIDDFTKAIELEPEKKEVYFARATCYLASNQYERATVDFTVTIQYDSRDSMAYFYRGMCFYRTSMIDLAMNDFKVATQLDHDNARAFNYLGCCLSIKKKYDEAIMHFERAVDLDPGLALAYFNAARCYYFIGDLKKAIRRYNMAIELDPDHANSYMGRAQVYDKMNKGHKALRDVKIALSKDPHNVVFLKYYSSYMAKFDQKGWLKKAVSSVKSKLHHHEINNV